jgi:hypothetical protein
MVWPGTGRHQKERKEMAKKKRRGKTVRRKERLEAFSPSSAQNGNNARRFRYYLADNIWPQWDRERRLQNKLNKWQRSL